MRWNKRFRNCTKNTDARTYADIHTNGSGSASMDLYMDDDENPTQYTALISFASETVTIVAYDAENVEPLA